MKATKKKGKHNKHDEHSVLQLTYTHTLTFTGSTCLVQCTALHAAGT